MLNFVVIGTQRTGSTFIRTSLDSHPDIRCFGELFTPQNIKTHSYSHYRSASLTNRISHYVNKKRLVYQYLDSLPVERDVKAAGFKIMYSQMRRIPYEFPMVLDYIAKHRLKVLHVVRKNVLKTIVSRARASKTAIWHSSTPVRNSTMISMEPKTLLARLEQLRQADERWRVQLRRFDTLEVAYEDFVREKAAVTARILGFLGVDYSTSLQSSLQKLTPDSLDTVILNIDEIRAALTNTEFEWCLDSH